MVMGGLGALYGIGGLSSPMAGSGWGLSMMPRLSVTHGVWGLYGTWGEGGIWGLLYSEEGLGPVYRARGAGSGVSVVLGVSLVARGLCGAGGSLSCRGLCLGGSCLFWEVWNIYDTGEDLSHAWVSMVLGGISITWGASL